MKTIINIIILIGSLFFNNFLYSSEKMQFNFSSGYVLNLQSENNKLLSGNLVTEIMFNPLYSKNYLDRIFLNIRYSRFDLLNYSKFYSKYDSIGIYYNLFDWSFLTFYIGYDIFGSYNGRIYESDNNTFDFNYKAKAGTAAVDIRIMNNIFIFFDYKIIKLSNFLENSLKISQYSSGIRLKFEINKINKIKNFGE